MPVFGKRVDVPGGRRRTARQRVVLAGSAVTLDGSRSVLVDDVCSSGLRLRGRDVPVAGETVVVKIGSADIMASVAWSSSDECGVTFDVPLDAQGVQQLRDEGQIGRVLGIL